jgi:hypothetical protein
MIEASVIHETEAFLMERGTHGVEGAALWLGSMESDTAARIHTVYVPAQVAYRSSAGLAVEIRPGELSRLIEWLPPEVFVLARVHSHGERAYHSETDDQNLVVGHVGAVSIVVPGFARLGLQLDRCAVHLLERGSGWRRLTPSETIERFRVR